MKNLRLFEGCVHFCFALVSWPVCEKILRVGTDIAEELVCVPQNFGGAIFLDHWSAWKRNIDWHLRVSIPSVASFWHLVGAVHKLFGVAVSYDVNLANVFRFKLLSCLKIKLSRKINLTVCPK